MLGNPRGEQGLSDTQTGCSSKYTNSQDSEMTDQAKIQLQGGNFGFLLCSSSPIPQSEIFLCI